MKNTTRYVNSLSLKNRNFKRSSLALALSSLFVLTGCAVKPQVVSDAQKTALQQQDSRAMFAGQEPLSGAITLNEALARALKYNLQERLALMKYAYEHQLLDTKRYDLLPSVAANAGWRTRSNHAASSSQSVSTGEESLEASTSQDRNLSNVDLSMSWNILDFGIGYFGAKAQGNNVLAAQEQRRAVVADIMQKVRKAYWAAATAAQLKPEVDRALSEANAALVSARQTQSQRLVPPLQAMQYQKSLLQMITQLETLSSELTQAKTRLAGLMNLAPGTPYTLAPVSLAQSQLPRVSYSLDKLETLAMVNRPEINEEIYKARNAVLQTRSELTHLLPGASLFVGGHYDSNHYLVNQSWADAGVRVSWNLMNVFSYSSIKQAGQAREQVAKVRRQALRMAVLTQVNVAWLQYQQTRKQYQQASELLDVQRGIARQTRRAGDMKSRLEQVQMLTETALITRHRDQQLAKAYAAYGAIYQAAGLDALPAVIEDTHIAALSAAIAQRSQSLAQGKLSVRQQQWLDAFEMPRSQSEKLAQAVTSNVTDAAVNPATGQTPPELAASKAVTPVSASDASAKAQTGSTAVYQTLGSLRQIDVHDYTQPEAQ